MKLPEVAFKGKVLTANERTTINDNITSLSKYKKAVEKAADKEEAAAVTIQRAQRKRKAQQKSQGRRAWSQEPPRNPNSPPVPGQHKKPLAPKQPERYVHKRNDGSKPGRGREEKMGSLKLEEFNNNI